MVSEMGIFRCVAYSTNIMISSVSCFTVTATHSYLKDTTLLVSLVVAVGGCWFAYVQHRYSQSHIKQMLGDMEGLQKAEDALSEMQEKLDKAQEEHQTAIREKQTIEAKLTDQISRAMQEAERLREARKADVKDGGCNTQVELEEKLRLAEEELTQLRNALQEAERRLESGSGWRPPAVLQQWLQLTYETEKKFYSFKKTAADKQLREAKDVVEKIRKKRGTFMGSFRIAHGNILDDVDARIVNARSALAEVTTELKERLHRWAMLEGLCDFNIINNPGIHHLITTLGVTMPESSTKSVRSALAFGGSIGAAMVVGSLAHVEANAPMGLDECDEDMPPPPTYMSAVSAGDTMPHQSLQTSSTLCLSEDKLSIKKSKSTNNIASYGSTLSLIQASNAAVKAKTPPPQSSMHHTDPPKFTEALSTHKKPDGSSTSGIHSTNRPQRLHVSHSENALASLVVGTENDKRHNESARGHESRKSKKDSKKSSSSQQDGDTDSLEMEEERKKKKRLRIPGMSASSKIERLKTC
ncbi:stromal interaction molecule 2-like [Patiria miniata]|uniref:STIM1/2 Orai1-activating region domain-containing protein n=1 Tax=Patiria miniata TaxID=46514 RepID=A0A913ZV29_PATMI|nr:stromal interaction molecule 2-like [Patiria miniata]